MLPTVSVFPFYFQGFEGIRMTKERLWLGPEKVLKRQVENYPHLERANEGSANKERVRRCAPDCNNSQPLKRADDERLRRCEPECWTDPGV